MHARRVTTPGRPSGFTLVELLMAITLLGLIAVVTYSAVWTAGRSLQAVESRVELSEEIRVTQQFLRQALMQSRGVMAIYEGRMRIVFGGQPHAIDFVAPAPLQRGGAGGLYRYRLTLKHQGDTAHSLLLSYWPYLAGNALEAEQAPMGTAVLSREVANLTFSYFGRDEPDAKPQWHDRWIRPDTLPQLVRIRLENRADEAPFTMTVAIKGGVG